MNAPLFSAASCGPPLPQNAAAPVEIYLVRSASCFRRERSLAARRKNALAQKALGAALVRWVFARHGMDKITLAYTKEGKPFVPDAALSFNISHSNQLLCAAFSAYPVGIDIEYLRPIAPGVMARFFARTGGEPQTGSAGPHCAFFTLWTRNEALLKAAGSGWRGAAAARHGLEAGWVSYQNTAWYLQSFCPDAGYAGALCSPCLLGYTFTELSCHDVPAVFDALDSL